MVRKQDCDHLMTGHCNRLDQLEKRVGRNEVMLATLKGQHESYHEKRIEQ